MHGRQHNFQRIVDKQIEFANKHELNTQARTIHLLSLSFNKFRLEIVCVDSVHTVHVAMRFIA